MKKLFIVLLSIGAFLQSCTNHKQEISKDKSNEMKNLYDYKVESLDGKEINFYSETEKFHIGRKRFDDVKDVLNYLGVKENAEPVERDFDEEMDPEFEAKSYRFTRKDRLR